MDSVTLCTKRVILTRCDNFLLYQIYVAGTVLLNEVTQINHNIRKEM